MKRWLFLLFVLPQCTGCLGYVYPSVAYTPEVVVPNQDSSAHAFRVDIDRSDRKEAAVSTVSRVTPPYYAASTEYTLTRIARWPRHVVPPKKACPPRCTAAMTSSVRRSSPNRTNPWFRVGRQTISAPCN